MHISQLVNHIYDRMNDKKKIKEEKLNGFLDGIKKVLIEFLEKENAELKHNESKRTTEQERAVRKETQE